LATNQDRSEPPGQRTGACPIKLPEKRIGKGRVEFPVGKFPSIVDRKIER
jgi:hypothetical protein